MASGGASQMPSALELERQQRILRNTQRLAELGLLQGPLSGAAEAAARADEKKRRRSAAATSREQGGNEHLVPQRQSRRQRGETPENAGHGYGASLGQQRERAAVPSIARQWKLDLAALDSGGDGDPAVDSHNLMRVRSMSERALQTRIWKIRRVDKLHSFIKVLEACGMAELAAEAREALAQMTGGAAEVPPSL